MPLPRSLRRAVALALCLAMALPPLIAPAALARVHSLPKPKSRGSAAARMVSLARKELSKGVHEIPDGSNRAPAIGRYETATRGAMFGAPWCAYFVSYIAKKAGVPIGPGGAGLGYVPYIRAWAKQTNRWHATPRAGDLITFPEHVGLVENVYRNHTLTTIEGNAGNAVRRRWRRWGEAMGYVRVAKGSSSAPAPAPAPAAPKKNAAKPKPAPADQPLRARITVYPDDTVAPGQTVSLTSNDSSGDIVSSAWDLDGNGKYDAKGDSVDRKYPKAGTYKVTLRVTDSSKRTATATQTITVRTNEAPVAVLSLNSQNLTVGDTLKGDAARSSDPDGDIVKYEWDLNGDGQWSEDGKTHTYTFGDPGDYNVGLRVSDDSGNVTETHLPVHVADLPAPVSRVACDTTTILAGHSVHCWADDSASPVKVVRHGWDLDGDDTDDKTGRDVRMTFDKAGTVAVRMRAYDQQGRTADDSVTITVTNNAPTAALAGPTSIGLGQTATFDGTDSDDVDGDIVRWQWDLDGDGTYESSGARPSFVYRAPGTYTLRLLVTDDDGGQATATGTIRVTDQAPTPRITLPPSSTRHVNTDLQFDATSSTDPDSAIATYEWDFDNDGVYETTGPQPTWRYTTTGRKTIRLRVTDVWGVSAVVTSTSLVVSS